MPKLHHQPLHVAAKVNQLVASGLKQNPPPWLAAVTAFPPTRSIVRPLKRIPNPKQKKARTVFMPPEIKYQEDELREEFFGDHPWELARPRVMLERPGAVVSQNLYSQGIKVPGQPTDGESVIQRWMYLMEHKKLPKAAAYDIARKEFYQVRHRQEVERAVAREEALNWGAHFDLGPIEVGNKLEDEAYNKFVVWAKEEAERKKQRSMASSSLYVDDAKVEEVAGASEVADKPAGAAVSEGMASAGALRPGLLR